MVLVAHEPEVVVGEVEDGPDTGAELHAREREGLALELGVRLVQVVEVQVRGAVDKAWTSAAALDSAPTDSVLGVSS